MNAEIFEEVWEMSLGFDGSDLGALELMERAQALGEIDGHLKRIWGDGAVESTKDTFNSLSLRYGKLPRAYLSGAMPAYEKGLLSYLAYVRGSLGEELRQILGELGQFYGPSIRPLRARFPVGSVLHRVNWRRTASVLKRGYKPFDDETNSHLRSIHEAEVLEGISSTFLSLVENGKASDTTASDLRTIMKLVVDVSDEQGEKRGSLDDYAQEFIERRVKENGLKFAAESLFEDLGDSPVQAQNLAWNFAELANMLYVAKDISRRNFLDTQSDPVKGELLHDLVSGTFSSIEEAIGYINKVEFRPVLTAHPTNVNRGPYLQLMLEFGVAALGITRKDLGAERGPEAADARKRYQKMLNGLYESQIIPPSKFTPADEMDIEKAALRNICLNMEGLRGAFDEAFETAAKKTGQAYTAEDRLGLHLNVKPLSWVMGDKDGNDNIKAEHLLRNMVTHRLAITRLYLKDLRDLRAKGIRLDNGPVDRSWLEIFADAQTFLTTTLQEVKPEGVDIPLSKTDFDRLTSETAFAFPLEEEEIVKRFSKALEKAYRSYPEGSEEQTALINLIDKVRSFGVSFASIELRETSSKYTDVLDFLFKKGGLLGEGQSYATMPETEKLEFLEKIYAEPEKLARPIREFLEGIDETKPRNENGLNLRDYANKEALVYHTLKRLELAAAHPDAVQDLVLAEFKESSKIVEVVALQKAIGRVAEYQPSMTVVPLFEEFGSLEGAPDMLLKALKTRAFRQHLLELAKGDPRKMVLSIQIAHSDNNRLSGMPAARAGIAEVHRRVPLVLQEHFEEIKRDFIEDEKAKGEAGLPREAFENMRICFEFFEGRSHSDAWRGGHRFSGALSNLLNTHECVWETFQGIDVFAYLQIPETFKRTVMHTICNNAARLAKRDKNGGMEAGASRTPSVEDAVIAALKRTAKDYHDTHFDKAAGELFGHPLVNRKLNGVLHNIGSRSVSRGGVDVQPTAAGEEGFDHTSMRAIPFGNNYLEAGIHPAILGAANIETYFAEAFANDPKALEDLNGKAEGFGFDKDKVMGEDGRLTAVGLQTLFKVSPVFRDVVHFLVTGVSMTTIEQTQDRFRNAEKEGMAFSSSMKTYLNKTVPLELAAASKLVLGAYGYEVEPALAKAISTGEAPGGKECSRLSFLVRNVTGIGQEMALTRNLRIFTQAARDRIVMKAFKRPDKSFTVVEMWMLKLYASAELCARHRSPTISDDNDMWSAKNADASTKQKNRVSPRAKERVLQADEVAEEAPAGTVCVRGDRPRRRGWGVRL